MILRRFMQHTKEQNWFAVGLDVIVVVVGIFLGMQVQQWYENHQFDVNERILLGKLKNELETNNRLTAFRIDNLIKVKNSGERAVAFLEANEPCTENCWSLLVDFFIASQSTPTPTVKTVSEEMRRLGLPRSKLIKEAIDDYYVFSEGGNGAIDLTPKYRDLIRELITIRAMKALWKNCHSFDKKGLEKLNLNCEQQLSDETIINLLDRLRREPKLLGYLSHWISMHYVYIPMFELQLEVGVEAIVVIDEII